MVRLVLLLGPIASALGGVFLGKCCVWSTSELLPFMLTDTIEDKVDISDAKKKEAKKKKSKKGQSSSSGSTGDALNSLNDACNKVLDSSAGKSAKTLASVFFFATLFF